MMKLDILNRVYREGIIAILRAESAAGLAQAAHALQAGGVSVLEVTMTTPGALDVIRQASAELGERACIGVGSVLDSETARLAILHGARFIVTPVLDVSIIRMANRYSVPVMMGCYTPTEVKTAWEEGADLVKLFPAVQGGAAYLKALRAPLPQVLFVPTGGIHADNAADFLRAGAFALGVGDSLVSGALLAAGDFATIEARARALRGVVGDLRGPSSQG
jgi:2-dehydro-3-deoxyphosphogluconate aldolase/(4S)-4-hydroxy-2-oxoglutarate aldolase